MATTSEEGSRCANYPLPKGGGSDKNNNTGFFREPVIGTAAAAAAKALQSCPTLCDPIEGSPPGFLSLGFSRQEHWSKWN